MLELALKHSIDWSIKNRNNKVDSAMTKRLSISQDKMPSSVNDNVEIESHIRAFITHFKIELNNLMDSRWIEKQHQLNYNCDINSLSDRDSIDTDSDELPIINVQYGPSSLSNDADEILPLIKINGKHFGLYNISDDQTLVNDDDIGRQQQLRQTSKGSRRATRQLDKKQHQSVDSDEYDDYDDGYRSLSRNSFKSNMIQQLNDIKSRLIDLVHEIDESVKLRLNKDDMEAYQRRRNALVSKLDSLIDSDLQNCAGRTNLDKKENLNQQLPVQISPVDLTQHRLTSSPSATATTTASSSSASSADYNSLAGKSVIKSSSNIRLHLGDYEEQVQVIDYNFRRRASDNFGMKRQKLVDKQDKLIPSMMHNSKSMAKIETPSGIQRPISLNANDLYANKQNGPIDFGAMMRNYEITKSQENMDKFCLDDANKKHSAKHIVSSTTTSNYSASSHSHSSSSSSYL